MSIVVRYHRPLDKTSYEQTFRVRFNEENIRCDRQQTFGPIDKSLLSIEILNPEQYIFYNARRDDDSLPDPSSITTRELLAEEAAAQADEEVSDPMPHPQFIGLAACSFESLTHYQRNFAVTQDISNGKAPLVDSAVHNGQKCLTLKYELGTAGDYILAFVDEELDNAVIRVEEVYEADQIFSYIDITYEQINGITLPQKYEYVYYLNENLFEAENAILHYQSVNEPLEKSLFTISGIPPEKESWFLVRSTENRAGEEFQWDGETLVAARVPEEDPPVISPDERQEKYIHGFLFLGSLLFLLVVLVFYYKKYRQGLLA